jgi:phage terminase large subunit GpA-like protein
MSESSVARIRELNDAFRKTFAGGKMVMTASVAALPEMVRSAALVKVAEFNDFTPENDPHGEHACFYHWRRAATVICPKTARRSAIS